MADTLSYQRSHYSETSSIVPVEGRLELTIAPSGEARSLVRRTNLIDVKRSGKLSVEVRAELLQLLDRWIRAPRQVAKLPRRVEGVITYRESRDEWSPDAALPEDLAKLVQLLERINDSLSLERTR